MVAAVSLGVQVIATARMFPDASAWQVLWRMAGYFTILTNVLVCAAMLHVGGGGRIGPRLAGGLALSILVVGVVYHALLADLWSPEGHAWWADQGLHTAVPLLMLLWWVGFAPKHPLTVGDVVLWLVWPLVYAAYALWRGSASGFYPYPFLDVAALGGPAVALNLVFLAVGFMALGGLLVGAARFIR